MKKLMLVSLLAVSLPCVARAITPAQGDCVHDAKTLCKGTKPGGGRMLACLKTNMAKLTPACQTQTKEWPKAQHAKPATAAPATKKP
jgi:hypothetical protein